MEIASAMTRKSEGQCSLRWHAKNVVFYGLLASIPDWPPVDGDGKVIGDIPWKFFNPEPEALRG